MSEKKPGAAVSSGNRGYLQAASAVDSPDRAQSQAGPRLKLLELRRIRNGTPQVALARIRLPGDVVLRFVRIIKTSSGFVVDPGSRPRLKDGELIWNGRDQLQYEPVVSFVDRAAGERFRDAVLDLIRAEHPGDLDGGSSL